MLAAKEESNNENYTEKKKLTHKHKSKLYAYLAVKNKFVGKKLGEAAKANAFDWGSKYLLPIKNLLQNI